LGPTRFPDWDLCNPRNSIHQRGDFRPLKVEFRLLHGRPVRFDCGLGAELGLNLVIELALSDGPGFCKGCVALHIKCAFAKLCLRLRKIALGPVQCRLERSSDLFRTAPGLCAPTSLLCSLA